MFEKLQLHRGIGLFCPKYHAAESSHVASLFAIQLAILASDAPATAAHAARVIVVEGAKSPTC